MHRFFLPQAGLAVNDRIPITNPREIHHLKNVLRLKPEDRITVFDGKGTEGDGTILSVAAQKVVLQLECIRNSPQKKLSVVLACAIPKRTKFESIIEKCTELGVDEIIPLKTQRSEVILTAEKSRKKILRYQTVAVNAARQAKRTTVPGIHQLTDFSDVLKTYTTPQTLSLIPALTGARRTLREALTSKKEDHAQILFLVGPEGDFTPQEINLAVTHGCIPISLGETVLKVETAAVTAVGSVNIFFPDR